MSVRAASTLAWAVCGTVLVLVACTVWLGLLNRSEAGNMALLVALVAVVVVGGVVASRRPANTVGWLFLASAVCFALDSFSTEYATYGLVTEPGSLPAATLMAWVQTWAWVPGVMMLFSLLPLYFPNGRLVSPRWRWVVFFALVFFAVLGIDSAFLSGAPLGEGLANPYKVEAPRAVRELLDAVVLPAYFAVLFASAASLVVRFRRSPGEERQQIKWLAFAVTTIPLWFLVNPAIDAVIPLPIAAIDALMFASLPVAAGIAILRYRLYDIDVLINRTLVYGSLTVTLAAVYFGSVVVLQRIFVAITGGDSQLTIVASTLAIAALFNPLRRRVQAFVDRRFYRNKYDAARTLEAFAAKLRDETDLDSLSGDVVAVIRETLEPEHASLWLRAPAADRRAPG
jgi:hypothetical protein